MSVMWIPAHTTVPPFAVARKGRRDERSHRSEDDRRVQLFGRRRQGVAGPLGPDSSANRCDTSSSARVRANTRRPSWTATWQTMWAAAPKPYKPSRSASPVIVRERYPIRPAQRSGAA